MAALATGGSWWSVLTADVLLLDGCSQPLLPLCLLMHFCMHACTLHYAAPPRAGRLMTSSSYSLLRTEHNMWILCSLSLPLKPLAWSPARLTSPTLHALLPSLLHLAVPSHRRRPDHPSSPSAACPPAIALQVPKAFKVIPNLQNWEEILYLTEPESWSPHAVYQVGASGALGWELLPLRGRGRPLKATRPGRLTHPGPPQPFGHPPVILCATTGHHPTQPSRPSPPTHRPPACLCPT